MRYELKPKALGLSLGIVSAIGMLLLTLTYYLLGAYSGVVASMQEMHMFYTVTFFGTIAGMIEAGIIGFAIGWFIAYLYNKF